MESYCYLDNSAVTRLDERVLEAMKPIFLEQYAVATSQFGYSMGIDSREILDEARASLAAHLKAEPEEIIFTSGSTESSNIALRGTVKASRKNHKHIIVSGIEDFPVLHTARDLERDGIGVTYLEVDEYGRVNPDRLREAIGDETVLVSIQHANQEIGTLQDIRAIGEICRGRGVLFHTDATHSFMRVPIDVKDINADLITFSAHTIHGPRGIGGLFVKKGTVLSKIYGGGFQEFDLRPGIENIPGAVGFARAASLVTIEENEKLMVLRNRLIELVEEKVPEVTLNGHRTLRLPQNANITFHRVEGESITLHMDMRGFAVSTGSACFSRSLEASHVIMAIGGDHERAHGSIRFSLSRFNDESQIVRAAEEISHVVEQLRVISPLGHPRDG